MKSKSVSFNFDSHVTKGVKVCDTNSLFDKMHQTAVNPATNKTCIITLHCRTLLEPNLSALTEKIHILLTLHCWFSFSEIKSYGILESANILKYLCYILL